MPIKQKKRKINYEIKNKFSFFEELLKGEKLFKEKCISLVESKKNHPTSKENISPIQHIKLEDEKISLKTTLTTPKTSNQEVAEKYSLRLFCKKLSQKPFIGFDSDGLYHINEIDGIREKIPTPHFNTFDKEGREIAYQTDVLKNPKESKVICGDINFCISLFFQETNINKSGDYPEVDLGQSDIFGKKSDKDVDPLEGINF